MVDGDGIAVRLFGKAVACSFGIDKAFPEKGFQLIALVALSSQRRITRKAAATTLWDKIDEAGALNNLRQLLARMRQQLPDLTKVITIDGRNITISGQGEGVDLCRFLVGDHAEILAVYKGVLLESQSEASETFSDWLQVQRTRLQEQFFRSCEQVLLDVTRLGRCSVETIVARENRLLALEPEREASYLLLIEAYGRCGHTREAARVSRALVAIARSEHGSLPLPETEAAVRRVLATAVPIEIHKSVQLKQSAIALPRVAFLQPRWGNIGTDASECLKSLIEDIVNELARYRTFVMLAPHTSFQIHHDSGLPTDNSQLRADYTVSGFVKPDGILSLRMVHFEPQTIIWAGEFPAQPEMMITCFNQLTRRIASNLASEVERHTLEESRKGKNVSAYVHYLRGEESFKFCDLPNTRRARKHYLEALSADSGFAEAHSGVAKTLYFEWILRGGDDAELLSAARKSADTAIHVDPNSAYGYWRKAMVCFYQHDFDVSESVLEQAQSLHPHHADIILDRGDILGHIGDAGLAQDLFQRAIDLNPMPPDHYWWIGAGIAFSNENYAGAVDLCGRLADDEPVLRLLAASHGQLRNRDEATSYGKRLRETYPNQSAYQMAKLQPHRTEKSLETFIEGLRIAGIK
jgi:DNA-binding SARP family transcriptional activator/TolB-like protein/Tfp pilus assembly protein PilF